jgi:uncharacterized membrane protein
LRYTSPMSYGLDLLVLLFFSYAFLGWINELLFVFITERRIHLAGFLTMPILPIYGVGALLILLFVAPYVHNPFLVFGLSVILATLLEYVTHWAIDKIFHVQLWNYSEKRFNVKGRICLENSLGFGALALLLIYIIHPFLSEVFGMMPSLASIIIAIVLVSLFAVDFANSLMSLIRVRATKLKGTLNDIQRHIIAELTILTGPNPSRRRLMRTRRAFLRLHQLNIRRLTHAFPRATKK